MIQQVLLNSVPPILNMMEDNVSGAMVKYDGKNEYDAAPPVTLWDSCFYRG